MKKRIVYSVRFECEIDLEIYTLDDALSDIDIPEGGGNNSVYCEGSFEVVTEFEEDNV